LTFEYLLLYLGVREVQWYVKVTRLQPVEHPEPSLKEKVLHFIVRRWRAEHPEDKEMKQ
jgi:hypothetical protein